VIETPKQLLKDSANLQENAYSALEESACDIQIPDQDVRFFLAIVGKLVRPLRWVC